MNPKNRILSRLRQRILLLDGAMGTELQKRGLPAGVCPEAWCLDHPAATEGIHTAYREAGSDIVYTATFGANRLKMGLYGLTNVRDTNRKLAEIAVGAAGMGLVAGDIGPTGRFVEPFGDLPFEEAVAIFREQAQGLLEGGVDLFVIETMMDIQEARAALIAVREVCDHFCMVTMTYEKHGRTLNGTDPVSALTILQGLGADAVGCNCSTGPEGMIGLISTMKPHAAVPLVAKPNAGLPQLIDGATVFDLDAAGFAGFGGAFAAAGVNLMGGCCGTTPAHLRALRDSLASEKPVAPLSRSTAAVSSARHTVVLEKNGSLTLIGSRMDATVNRELHQGLLTQDLTQARQAARSQEKEGAQILLLKTGIAGLDESKAVRQTLEALSPTMRPPLLIAAEKIETVERALRFYPGRPMVRITGTQAATLLPMVAKYGAIPVLPMPTPDAIPANRAAVRQAVADARLHGFARGEIVIDCTPQALDPEAVRSSLGMISWCEQSLGCRTFLDLTGFGKDLPEPCWVQAFLLAAAQASGLTMALADPSVAETMKIRAAGDRFRGT